LSIGRKIIGCIHRWQSLTSAMIALGAAAWAWQYTQWQIDIAREQLSVAARQADAAQKQIEIAARQADNSQRQLKLMELDQRPYIWPENKGLPEYDAISSRIAWSWDNKNIGKSPAIVTRQETFMKLGDGPLISTQMSDNTLNIVPVGSNIWSTVFSGTIQKKKDFDRLINTYHGIQIAIRMTYSDGRGNDYKVDRCFAVVGNGAVSICSVEFPPG
jgi:hypothetical protein